MAVRDKVGVKLGLVETRVFFLVRVELVELGQGEVLSADDTCHLRNGQRHATQYICNLPGGVVFWLVKIGGEMLEQGETVLLCERPEI